MWNEMSSLAKRVYVEITASTTAAERNEMNRDNFRNAGKYGYGFVYFAVVLLVCTSVVRFYNTWGDKMRIVLHRENGSPDLTDSNNASSPDEYELPSAGTDASSAQFFPSPNLKSSAPTSQPLRRESFLQRLVPLNKSIALFRWVFYRPIPSFRIGSLVFAFPSGAVVAIIFVALVFVVLYCFVPQPLYYWSIALGSPPLAIRAGMLAVAMVPWIVALATKANLITMLTGLGPERLNGLHRWSAYICLFLCLVHMIPFYVTPIWTDGAMINYRNFYNLPIYVYGTGWAAMVPMLVLCIHSLPFLRHRLYELFIYIHIPVSWIFVAMLIWHTKNYLHSWGYLFSTVAIWAITYFIRLFYLNWSSPFRTESFMIGEECSVTLLPQNAIKVTIPTEMRWRPGQYVYLRMPRIALFESHPFTIASLCSDDLPSAYGQDYRDMTLVFRPFKGFTRKVLNKALEMGPFQTYSAYVEGPYGGMHRQLAAFDDVVFFAGEKIRDGKAVTKSVKVIWILRNAETMEWFQEELRICRDSAPANIVNCHFFLTGLNQVDQAGRDVVQEKIYDMLQGIDKRSSAYIQEVAAGDEEREKELRRENEDGIAPLPNAYAANYFATSRHYPQTYAFPQPGMVPHGAPRAPQSVPFDFGFGNGQQLPQQTAIPKQTPRYASFQPMTRRDNWKTDYFRPDVPKMLNEFSKGFGRRACVFVCGPPSLRVDVANTVAKLQMQVLTDSSKDEIYLHAENYNI
ncbi:hypothetical protein N7470_007901 [Penicillium chermesinum]|nr:hypothetical protein N7470_007901 [Penicillium chermesinum]